MQEEVNQRMSQADGNDSIAGLIQPKPEHGGDGLARNGHIHDGPPADEANTVKQGMGPHIRHDRAAMMS